MQADIYPLQMLLMTVAGWVNRVLSIYRAANLSPSNQRFLGA